MKRRNLQDLKTKRIEELKMEGDKFRLEYRKTLLDLKGGKEKNLKKARNIRRDLAQVLTLIREKEILEDVNKKSAETKETK